MCNRLDLKLKLLLRCSRWRPVAIIRQLVSRHNVNCNQQLYIAISYYFSNRTLNVIMQRQNLTQSFTEEVHLYQDLQSAQQQDIWQTS